MLFPHYRARRTRKSETIRKLVRETTVLPSDLVYPLFVVEGLEKKREIKSMPGQYYHGLRSLVEEAKATAACGVPAVILFGIPARKDEVGKEAFNPKGVIQQAVRAIKKKVPEMCVITDVCLCEYTSHGHCGIVQDGKVNNDVSIEILAQVAVSHAQAGADVVAPSDMMDGRVTAIRGNLDNEGFRECAILSYAAKYASAFYGPFREAVGSTPEFGDRRGYQMDPANVREALREVGEDIAEGADMVMIKPALPYLDVVRAVRDKYDYPLAAYSVSGEYAMIEAAATRGLLDRERAIEEMLGSIKRAGADIILTYHAREHAEKLSKK